jgi:hypothetical protein
MTKEIRNCEFRFKCPRSWDGLEETADERVRHCNECNRMVVLCRTAKQLKRAIIDNFCVAIEIPDSDSEVQHTVGVPVYPYDLEQRVQELEQRVQVIESGLDRVAICVAVADPDDVGPRI